MARDFAWKVAKIVPEVYWAVNYKAIQVPSTGL
jgi:hypothetical protein